MTLKTLIDLTCILSLANLNILQFNVFYIVVAMVAEIAKNDF